MRWIKIKKNKKNLPVKMQECLFTNIELINPFDKTLMSPNTSFGWFDGEHF